MVQAVILYLFLAQTSETISAKLLPVVKTGEDGLTATAKMPVFEGTSKLVPLANGIVAKLIDGRLNDGLEAAKQANLKDEYRFTSESHVETILPSCIGTWYQFTSNVGGTVPPLVFDTRNFGFVQGKPAQLRLKNLFTKDPSRAISKLTLSKLLAMKGAVYVQDRTVRDLSEVQLEQFVITRDGLLFLFEPQTMGPQEAGSFKVLLKFSELSNLDKTGALRDVLALPKIK